MSYAEKMGSPDFACAGARLIALVYSDGARAGRVLDTVARSLQREGLRCAGFVQFDQRRPGRSRCDMILENVRTGVRVQISEDRGPQAQGCILDPHALLTAMADAREQLGEGADVLLLNKFGKAEAEGSGFRPLIADAVASAIPVVIGVPRRNLESWRVFANDLAMELDLDDAGDVETSSLIEVLRSAVGSPDSDAVEPVPQQVAALSSRS